MALVGVRVASVVALSGGGRESVVNADEAVESVGEHIRQAGLDYPITGLVADRFEAGWSVYAPAEAETGDPTEFSAIPVGRAVFLISDSGRVQEIAGRRLDEACRQFGIDESRRGR